MAEIEIEGLTVVDGIEKLQECFLFKTLSFEQARRLGGICTPVSKKDGEVIIEENSIGQGLFLVVRGEARVFQGEGEAVKTLATLKPGEIFGEMSLMEDMLTSSSVAAAGNTELLKIDKRELEKLMEADAVFAARIYRSFCIVLSDRLRKANQKLKEVNADG